MSGDLTPQLLTLSLLLLHVNQQAEKSQSRKTNNSQTRKDRNSNNKKREKRKCNFCGTEGHIAKDCRKRKRKQGECFHCGETGHISKDCPKKQTGPSGGTSLTSFSRCFVLSCYLLDPILRTIGRIFLDVNM